MSLSGEGEPRHESIAEWRKLPSPRLAQIAFITSSVGIVDIVYNLLVERLSDDPSDEETVKALEQVEMQKNLLSGQDVKSARRAAEASVNPPRPGTEYTADNHEALSLSERAENDPIFKEIARRIFRAE